MAPPSFPNVPIQKGELKLCFGNGGIIIIAGRTNTGKTQRLRQILIDNAEQYQYVAVFCPEITKSEDYDFIHDQKFISRYSEDKLNGLITLHENIKQETKEYLRGVVILDDCIGDENVNGRKDNALASLAIRARKTGITLIVLVQRVVSNVLGPLLREACNYMIVTSPLEAEAELVKKFTSNGLSKQQFNMLFNHYIREYAHLMFDNTPQAKDRIILLPPKIVGKYRLFNCGN